MSFYFQSLNLFSIYLWEFTYTNKLRYLIDTFKRSATTTNLGPAGDDEAEAKSSRDSRDNGNNGGKKGKAKGQNKDRKFGSWYDAIKLCNTVATVNEFSPKPCQFGEKCKASHDLREYLANGKSEDLTTFDAKCPVWEVNGRCHAGWKCRFVGSHSKEIEREDGRKELVLIEDENASKEEDDFEIRKGVVNVSKLCFNYMLLTENFCRLYHLKRSLTWRKRE